MPVSRGVLNGPLRHSFANPINGSVVDQLVTPPCLSRVSTTVYRALAAGGMTRLSSKRVAEIERAIVLLVEHRRDGAQHVLLETSKVPGRVASRANSFSDPRNRTAVCIRRNVGGRGVRCRALQSQSPQRLGVPHTQRRAASHRDSRGLKDLSVDSALRAHRKSAAELLCVIGCTFQVLQGVFNGDLGRISKGAVSTNALSDPSSGTTAVVISSLTFLSQFR